MKLYFLEYKVGILHILTTLGYKNAIYELHFTEGSAFEEQGVILFPKR